MPPTLTLPTFTLIEDFDVFYSSNSTNGFYPEIWLFNGGKSFGQLFFQPDGTALPADTNTSGGVTLYYHLEDFANVIGLLRDEKTVYLLYGGGGRGNQNGPLTDPELVGT